MTLRLRWLRLRQKAPNRLPNVVEAPTLVSLVDPVGDSRDGAEVVETLRAGAAAPRPDFALASALSNPRAVAKFTERAVDKGRIAYLRGRNPHDVEVLLNNYVVAHYPNLQAAKAALETGRRDKRFLSVEPVLPARPLADEYLTQRPNIGNSPGLYQWGLEKKEVGQSTHLQPAMNFVAAWPLSRGREHV